MGKGPCCCVEVGLSEAWGHFLLGEALHWVLGLVELLAEEFPAQPETPLLLKFAAWGNAESCVPGACKETCPSSHHVQSHLGQLQAQRYVPAAHSPLGRGLSCSPDDLLCPFQALAQTWAPLLSLLG